MKKRAKYLSNFLVILLISLTTWATISTPNNNLFHNNTFNLAAPPDTTLIYPIPKIENSNPNQTIENKKLYIESPSNITEEFEYDPLTNSYNYYQKVGNMRIFAPKNFTLKEYSDINLNRSLRNYWQERALAKQTGSSSGIIPQIHLKGKVFDQIFGGNTIDIRPQGSVMITFGVRSDKRDDPLLDQRQRRQTNFDFKQSIQMSVLAKIGDKIEFNTNYNTESTFDFENKLKLKYEGKEDDIVKLIEAGDVTLPLTSSLITGSQSLFGIKTQMQFGRALFTGVFSQQKSESSNITVQGGAQLSKFKLKSLDYEDNRHFFLSQYFYNNYDKSVEKLPLVLSNINITKIEVWVTNIGPAVTENRNIVAFMDIGEPDPFNQNINHVAGSLYPNNTSNDMFYQLDTFQIRSLNNVSQYLTTSSLGFTSGTDFEKVENARKLKPNEYTFNSKLGFISLNTSLNPDQVLAVAFQYTVIGSDKTYQVGELSDQGINSPSCLMVKLLKSTALNTKTPTWKLMMKNVYNIGAFQVNNEDFILNILYSGNENTVPTGYFTEGNDSVKGIALLRIFNFDKLDNRLNPPYDGMFDFIDNAATQGGTVQASNGRIYFPATEPFGKFLRKKLEDNILADKYCFDSLYTLSKSGAEQYPNKNRYLIEGHYKSSYGSEISLNALNVPQGSVRVTAGGIQLQENIHYSVDYVLGRVKILDEGILNSGTPINIALENNATFNLQTQTMIGLHLDYKINKDLVLGATLLRLHEKPLTRKTNFGQEPISNTMWGFDVNYTTESQFITKLIDKLPFYSTKAPSRVQFNGEFAHFIPGHARAIGRSGTSYIDDFEGSKSTIDLRNIGAWTLASVPQGQFTPNMFPEAMPGTGLQYGFNRAKLAWYNIDQMFYDTKSNLLPPNITKDELSKHSVRRVLQTEVYPNADPEYNEPMILSMINLAYFPDERGPYNYNYKQTSFAHGLSESGKLIAPSTRWSGIMRKIEPSDFEAANIDYIEFWLMDPFADDSITEGGDLYFNLGDISEDILRDGRKSYENGLPTSENVINVDTTIWGRVPTLQSLVNAFDNNIAARKFQDVGLDGLGDEDERKFFDTVFISKIAQMYGAGSEVYQQIISDPSADNYHFYRGSDYDNNPKYGSIIERYKNYNGMEGNSPASETTGESYLTQASTLPDAEDINRDNTLNENERYYQYQVKLIRNQMSVGENYIADIYHAGDIHLANGKKGSVKWYQFKIPIHNPDAIIGNIEDFKSIRFMRMFLKNFNTPIVLRMASLQLVRGEWRKYYGNLLQPGDYPPNPNQNQTTFDISAVNIEENSSRQPIPYVLPPDIEREINVGTATTTRQNEQSMVFDVCNMLDGDARAVYKTTDFDFRQYKKIKMYVHAEKSIENEELQRGDLTVFIRIGSDFTQNYYEYELPVEFTPWFTSALNVNQIWPDANKMEIDLEKLVEAKLKRNENIGKPGSMITVLTPFKQKDGNGTITVMGMPNLGNVNAFMIGVRNPKKQHISDNDDGKPKCAEIWINELRLTDFNEKSGWAATARVSSNLADLGNIVFSGRYSTPGFGSIEKKVNERSQETLSQFDIASNIQLGKFFPEKVGIRIPVHIDYSELRLTPKYNPLDPDILYKEQVKNLTKSEKDSLNNKVQDFTRRTNINFVNVRKDRVNQTSKPHFYDIENFDFTYAYSEIYHRNIDIEYDSKKNYRGGFGYNFVTNPKVVKPFNKVKFLSHKSLALIKDFNFYYIPRMFAFRTDMNREYNERLIRNKSGADIIIEPTYIKKWDWNRIYDFKFDLTQSVKLEYQANANAYVNEPPGRINRNTDSYKTMRDSIMKEILNFGSMNQFTQNFHLNYNIPINKIPFLNWLSSSANYKSTYRWEASPISVRSVLGNTIENSNTINLNGSAQLNSLYSKVKFLNNIINNKTNKPNERQTQKAKNPFNDDTPEAKENDTIKNENSITFAKIMKNIGIGTVKIITGFKNVQLSYSSSNGTMLPGFMPKPDLFGNRLSDMAPGLGFAFGLQDDIRDVAELKDWISKDTMLNNPFVKRLTENINGRANFEPFTGFRIEFNVERIKSMEHKEFYKSNGAGSFSHSNPSNTGAFSISFFTLKTIFDKIDKNNHSHNFETFKDYRNIIALRLSENNQFSNGINDSTGFPNGYGPGSTDVLIPAFIAAYSGANPNKIALSAFPKIPMPNWRINYSGLSNLEFLKKYFKQVNINHAYRSNLNISGYASNLNYFEIDGMPSTIDFAGNFITKNQFNQVIISEQFSPLINIDLTWNNSMLTRFEIKRTRNLALSFVNNQLTEAVSNELIIGLGYRFKEVKFKISTPGSGKRKELKSDLNVKLDFSLRDNYVILRRLDEDVNQKSSGAKIISINTSADYVINQRINARIFFEKTITAPHVSNQIKNSSTYAGLSLRITLAQ